MLLPFVADCDDEIRVLRRARLLWLAITLAFLVGLAAWLAQLSDDPRARVREAALGVALLALVPAFLEWSLQLRTDQIALANPSAALGSNINKSERFFRVIIIFACRDKFKCGVSRRRRRSYCFVYGLSGSFAGALSLGDRLWRWRGIEP